MAEQDSNLLEVKNLSIKFKTESGYNPGVEDLSFTLKKGEILGVVGESGSGKSVSSLAIMGLLSSPPAVFDQGEIWFNTRDGRTINLLNLSEKEMQQFRGNEIAMIFQEPMTSLNPVMKCGTQVVEALLQHKKMSQAEAKEKCLELFQEVKLPRPDKIYESYPHQISGGQKQRVMIAMAISCEPALLIADEPTTALDVTIQKTIIDILKALQQKYSMSVIFITHDLGVIAEIAQRSLVMFRGKLLEEAQVEDLFSNPKHAYTKGLIACRPPVDQRFLKLPTVADFLDQKTEGSFPYQLITTEEREKAHEKIYEAEPLMKVNQLLTEFVLEKSLFGKAKKSLKAVNKLSFEVFKGETLGLVGESGCGKTTLGRSLLRMIESKSGEIYYKGMNLTKMKASQLKSIRKEIQIIFQDPYSSLNPRLTIGEAILEPMKVHGIGKNNKERKNEVCRILERVGLKAEHYNRYPHEFSGGQRQRIVVARSLVLKPELIVCDESVSALDVSVQAQVLNLLNELKADFGFTYIFISHDLSVVKFMSDRIMVMQQGNIVEMGEADKVYYHPQIEYTKTLIDSIPKGL